MRRRRTRRQRDRRLGSGWIQIGASWQTFAKVIGVRDLNNDGRADLVGVTPSGQFHFYPGNGSKGFAGPGQYKASGWLLDKVFAAI